MMCIFDGLQIATALRNLNAYRGTVLFFITDVCQVRYNLLSLVVTVNDLNKPPHQGLNCFLFSAAKPEKESHSYLQTRIS